MEEQVFSAWHRASQSSCMACRPLKKAQHGQQPGREAGRVCRLCLHAGNLSAAQGFLQCPAQPVHKPTVLGRAELQRPAIKPTHIKEKVNLRFAFFLSKCHCPFLSVLSANPRALSDFPGSCLCLLISQRESDAEASLSLSSIFPQQHICGLLQWETHFSLSERLMMEL